MSEMGRPPSGRPQSPQTIEKAGLVCPPRTAWPDHLRVVATATKGRGVVLAGSNTVEAGAVLFASYPYAYVLQQHLWESCCACCFERGPLRKCARCGVLRYCGQACQKTDWKHHARECAALKPFVLALHQNSVPAEDATDLMLLGRTLRKMERENSPSSLSPTAPTPDHCSGISSPLSAQSCDIRNMCLVRNLLKEKICVNLVLNSGLLPSATTGVEVETYLRAFQCNNFAICDALMSPLAAGVYPFGSLLNHSCRPNCILVYDSKSHVQVCRALTTIHPGDELCHLYIEAALPTVERQLTLQATYDFLCGCERCLRTGDADPEACLRQDRWGRAIIGMEAIDDDVLASASAEKQSNAPSTLGVLQDLVKIRGLCRQAVAAKDVVDELALWSRAVSLLEPIVHPMNLDLYSTRCQAFSTALLVNDRPLAIKLGEQLVSFLEIVYRDIPHHPILGLQLHTLGDLHEEIGNTEESRQILQRTKRILSVVFGTEHNLVKSLSARYL